MAGSSRNKMGTSRPWLRGCHHLLRKIEDRKIEKVKAKIERITLEFSASLTFIFGDH